MANIESKFEKAHRPIDSMTEEAISKKLNYFSKKYKNDPDMYVKKLKELGITPQEFKKYRGGKKR